MRPNAIASPAASSRPRAEWTVLAGSLFRAVSGARDRGHALDACEAAATEIHVRGDAFELGSELRAVGQRSSDRREREIADGLAMCFYQSAVVVNPMLPLLASAFAAAALGGLIVALAVGEVAIAIVACLVAIALLGRAGVLVYQCRHADWSEQIAPPTKGMFLRRECIRKLPDRRGAEA
jgi:hypothetical protein